MRQDLDDLKLSKLADLVAEVYYGHRCRGCLTLDWETIGILMVRFQITLSPTYEPGWKARCEALECFDTDPIKAIAKAIIQQHWVDTENA